MSDVPPVLLQFLGSLVAIFVLAGLAWKLGLGAPPRLKSEAEARIAADQVVSGFEPTRIALDADGSGAIMSDDAGRIMVVRRHGSHFAGRILTPVASAAVDGEALLIATGEKRFGSVRLTVEDASSWMQAIEAIKSPANA